LGQTYFADMCFYLDVRAALTLNSAAVLDAHVFGDTFDGSMDALQAWDTVRAGMGGPDATDQGSGSRYGRIRVRVGPF
jgi:hypothetical protein